MTPQSFIFIGRSGCGKGTQAKFLQDFLKKNDPARAQLYIQTGAEFRKFIEGNSITQKLSKEVYDKGAFQPEFLAIYMWTNVLVNQYTKDEHIIMDGMPRMYHEAGVLDSVWRFYGVKPPHVVYIDISKEESRRRLLARHRFDDTEEEIAARLQWYEDNVVPTLDFFKNNPDYNYLTINGEQDPAAVFADILKGARLG
jgi:adenylate kinase